MITGDGSMDLLRSLREPMHQTLLAEATAVVAHESALLDERRFEEWLALYSEECLYWMPIDPTSISGEMRLNVFYCDRSGIADRIDRIGSGAAYSEEPATMTSRVVSVVAFEVRDAGASCELRSSFVLVAQRDTVQRVFGGRYVHRLVRRDGILWIQEKRVTMLGSDTPQRAMAFLF